MPLPPPVDLPRVEHAGIVIDGQVEPGEWDAAARLGDFVTFQPVPGKTPTGQTTARVLADDQALYLLFEVVDPQPGRIRATFGRRDSRFEDDFVAVYLDPGAEAQRAYVFGVNPLGLQMDGVVIADGSEDFSWDTTWQSFGRLTDDGYRVEVAIPWRSIRHERVVERMGLQVFRKRAANGEKSSWPPLDFNVQGVLVQQGVLLGPGPLERTVGLDIIPELTFGWTDQGPDVGRWGVAGVAPGLTVQWSPTPADSVVATVNPDFSQVESDASQIAVNRRYALSYDEQRPFFLEGQEWFSTPMSGLVYTRSMVAPRAGLRATTSRSGFAAAALSVYDSAPSPSVSEGGGWTADDLAGRDAVASLARARAPVGADGYVGALYSDRTVVGAGLANRLGGADTRLRLSDRLVIDAAALGSHTTLSDGSVLVGPAGAFNLHYDAEHFWFWSESELISPDFRAENGFKTRSDIVGTWIESGYTIYPNGSFIRRVNFLPADIYAWWHLDGRMRELIVEPDISWTWANGTFGFVEYQYNNELFAGEWFTFHRWEGGGGGQLSTWLGLYTFAGGGQGLLYDADDPRLGLRHWVELEPTVQPVHWLELSAAAVWERFQEAQWGDVVYQGWTGRGKVEAFASRRVWTRLVIDHDAFNTRTSGEALVAWEPSPGRALYLGAGSSFQAVPEWGVFAKGSWMFSL